MELVVSMVPKSHFDANAHPESRARSERLLIEKRIQYIEGMKRNKQDKTNLLLLTDVFDTLQLVLRKRS